MEVRVQIGRDDIWQVTRYVTFRDPRRAIFMYLCLLVFLWAVFSGSISKLAHRPWGTKLIVGLITTAVVAGPICLVLYLLAKWVTLWRAARSPGVMGEHVYAVSEAGLSEKTAVNEGVTAWGGVTRIVTTGRHILFLVGPGLAHVIPYRDFRDAGEMGAFLELVRGYWRGATKGRC